MLFSLFVVTFPNKLLTLCVFGIWWSYNGCARGPLTIKFNSIKFNSLGLLIRVRNYLRNSRYVVQAGSTCMLKPKLVWYDIKCRQSLLAGTRIQDTTFTSHWMDSAPQYMNDCLVVNRPRLCSVTTCSGHGLNLLVPKTHKCTGDGAFSVAAPQLWNKLPNYIWRGPNVDTFKTLVKTYLFKNFLCRLIVVCIYFVFI